MIRHFINYDLFIYKELANTGSSWYPLLSKCSTNVNGIVAVSIDTSFKFFVSYIHILGISYFREDNHVHRSF